MLTLLLFGGLAILLFIKYLSIKSSHTYFKKRNIPVPIEPNIFVGNDSFMFIDRKNHGEYYRDLYLETRKSYPFFGRFSIQGKTLVINDLEAIKMIMTKDFVHFTDHNPAIDENADPLQNHLFSLTGEKWKNLRVKLTPTFTTSKMRYMFQTIADCNKEMLLHLNKNVTKDNDTINVKELFTILNTDVIGSCAFGVESNSFKNPDGEFLRMGKLRAKQTSAGMKMLLKMLFPAIFGRNPLPRTDKEVEDFFYGLVEKTMKYRTENNVTRKDFMQLIIQLQKDGKVEDETIKEAQVDDGVRLTTMQCAAQVFVFFLAGFETSSTTASFALYELARNPDVQQTLRENINEVLEKHNGEISYDSLMEMSYLGLVIDETLRKYPPLPIIMRVCTKPYTFPGTNSTVEKGTFAIIPILGIHNDPDIFPNPKKFDPERFTPENKASRNHYSYMPFGEGPRICIGSRFGLAQTKLGLANIISNYEVSICDKSPVPMKFNPKSFVLATEGGLWLRMTPINKKK